MTLPLRFAADLEAGGEARDGGDLLAEAFAACLLESLERSATNLRFEYARAAVHVVAERHSSPPRFDRVEYELELETDEPQGRVDLLHRSLLRLGPVTSTLAEICEIEGSVRVLHPTPA